MSGTLDAQFLVAYVARPSRTFKQVLHGIMAPRLVEGILPGASPRSVGVLPSVAGPFSREEAAAVRMRIGEPPGRGAIGGPDLGYLVQLQPSVEELVPLPADEARRIARRALREEDERLARAERGAASDPDVRQAPMHFWVGAFELPRCWALLFFSGFNMPPGVGVVVDKYSRTAFVVPWVYLESELEDRGCDLSEVPGRRCPVQPPKRPTRSDLTADPEDWDRCAHGPALLRLADTYTTEPDGSRVELEVWQEQVTGLHLDIDAERRRFRWGASRAGGPGEWELYED